MRKISPKKFTKNIREARYAYFLLVKQHASHNSPEIPYILRDLEQYCAAVSLTAELSNKINDVDQFLSEAKQEFTQKTLSDEQLSWITPKNERLCYWIWLSIVLDLIQNPLLQSDSLSWLRQTNNHFTSSQYAGLSLPTSCNSAEERYNTIIAFFDLSFYSREDKASLLKTLQKKWEHISNFEKFNWLDQSDPYQVDWLWQALNEQSDSNAKSIREHIPEPTETYQKAEACVALFDTLYQTDDSKELLLLKLKRSWSQKKYRKKMTGKKSYSFLLSENAKATLDKNAKASRMNQSEYLEWVLVNNLLPNGDI